MENKIVCPECRGEWRVRDLFQKVTFTCELCSGIGFVTASRMAWVEQGRKLRDYRHKSLTMTLREAAIKYNGGDAMELRRTERGIIEPVNIYEGAVNVKVNIWDLVVEGRYEALWWVMCVDMGCYDEGFYGGEC